MTVRVEGDLVRLEGRCPLEDAEPLASLLAGGKRLVALDACEDLHAAVVQALLAFRPALATAPSEPFLRELVIPALALPPAPSQPKTPEIVGPTS